MGGRQILHSDMNSFYASVEIMLDPSLRGRPVAVCGCTEDRHGIVLAKSDAAKKAGVKTGMVNWEAQRLCPDLVTVPPHYEQYLKYSRLAREIYYRYTDLVEPFGMDECWLDVTGSSFAGSGMDIALAIRRSVREELGLTVSVGVSYNKIFAKLGSDLRKPDAVTEITEENFRELVWPLDCGELLYVGPATRARLARYGIRTVGQLAACSPEILRRWFGVNGLRLCAYARGTDTSRVMHRDFVSPVKSVGHGVTCTADLQTDDEVRRVILELSQDVGHRLKVHGLDAGGVQLSLRGGDLLSMQAQCRMPLRTRLPSELAACAFRLYLEKLRSGDPVRSVCVRATELCPEGEPLQQTLFADCRRHDRLLLLQDTVETLRGRFGAGSLTYASLLGDLKIPGDGRELVKMPGLMYA